MFCSTLEQGKTVRSSPLKRKEWQRQHVINWLQPLFPIPTLWGRRQRKSGVKLNPVRKEGWGKVFLRCGFIYHYPTLILTDSKLISPSWVFFVCGSNCSVISPCPYLGPWAFHYIFPPLPSWGREQQSSFGGHPAFSHSEPSRAHSNKSFPVLSVASALAWRKMYFSFSFRENTFNFLVRSVLGLWQRSQKGGSCQSHLLIFLVYLWIPDMQVPIFKF